MDHAEIKELLPLKALAKLEGDEARAVNEHLAAGCPECEGELKSFDEALAAMASVEGGIDGSENRVWRNLQARMEPAGAGASGVNRPAARIEDRAIRRSSPSRFVTIFGSAAVGAAVAAAIATLFVTPQQNLATETGKEIAALTARVIDVQRKLDSTGDQLAALQARVAQTTDFTLASLGPDAHVARLAGLAASPTATGTIAISHSQGTAILETNGLPPTPDDKQYEAWWIGAKQGPIRAGVFDPNSEGATIVSLDMPPADEVVLASAVTLEPRGGVDKPSGAMYLKGDFPLR